MPDYKKLCQRMKEIIGFKHPCVAVTLVKEGMEVPDIYKTPEKPMSHCQSIMTARKGGCLYLPPEKHSCPTGASSLGLMETPEKIKFGEFHHKIGLFGSVEAAAKMIAERYECELGSVLATAVAPVDKAEMEPSTIVVTGLPEEIYWLIPAYTFNRGGRVTVSTAAFQATCVDATLVPYLTGKLNLSLGCFGCRRRTDIKPEEMLAGIPPAELEGMIDALEHMNQGPIQKARKL